jgi:hypothetical protein
MIQGEGEGEGAPLQIVDRRESRPAVAAKVHKTRCERTRVRKYASNSLDRHWDEDHARQHGQNREGGPKEAPPREANRRHDLSHLQGPTRRASDPRA